jgi:hypothetical protein
MSFLKGLLLFVFSLLLVAFLVLFQVDNTLNSTVLSSAYFNNAFDKNVTQDSIKNFSTYLKDSVGNIQDKPTRTIVQGAIDVQWLQNDLPAFLKGSVAYFTTDQGKLPVISIKPFEDSLKNLENQAGPNALLVEAQLGLSQMKDTLDLNALVAKMYGSNQNLMTALPDVLTHTRHDFFMIIFLVTLLLLAILAVIAFLPRTIFRCFGICLLIAGILCAIPALAPMVFHGPLTAQVSAAVGSASQPDLAFAQNWVLAYIGGIANFMLIQGIIAALLGVALLIAAGFIGNKKAKAGAAKNGHMLIRAVAAVVLLIAIPFCGYFMLKDLYPHVKQFQAVKTSSAHVKMTFWKAFDATVGGHLGQQLQSLSK